VASTVILLFIYIFIRFNVINYFAALTEVEVDVVVELVLPESDAATAIAATAAAPPTTTAVVVPAAVVDAVVTPAASPVGAVSANAVEDIAIAARRTNAFFFMM
jgi:hypothetical protein